MIRYNLEFSPFLDVTVGLLRPDNTWIPLRTYMVCHGCGVAGLNKRSECQRWRNREQTWFDLLSDWVEQWLECWVVSYGVFVFWLIWVVVFTIVLLRCLGCQVDLHGRQSCDCSTSSGSAPAGLYLNAISNQQQYFLFLERLLIQNQTATPDHKNSTACVGSVWTETKPG